VTSLERVLGEAREQFLAVVADIRPELHRYCARLTGSVIDGEDIVQETLAKAFYALSQSPETPPLRPWLFRIAHNTAIDFLRSHARKTSDDVELDDVAVDDALDPVEVRAALHRFLTLPVRQRSAVILKDVLGHSLEETAETMGTTVLAVKAALVRGRASFQQQEREGSEMNPTTRDELEKYARLFNARDWDGVRGLISDDCRLDLVAKSQRRGKQVGLYFSNYEKANVTLRVVKLDAAKQLALAAFVDGTASPAYFILLEHDDHGRVSNIRDFRYVPYIAVDAEIETL
jgi:RNA polymerase sigma-70 factor (ECF subfamily)